MKILISNDDGIDSEGIWVLAKALKEIGEVFVVAPQTEQSAVGHAITMKIPLRVQKRIINEEFFGYAVSGTPADCVKMGIRNLMDSPPDIVVSGINHGSNTAVNIIYSGTVGAAREAAMMDVPSIAMSITDHNPDSFEYAGKIAQKMCKLVHKHGLPNGTLLNVNVPNLPEDKIKGIKITEMGKSRWDDIYEKRIDPYGNDYYWLTGKLIEEDETLNQDQFAVKQDYVAVSPIHFDLTDHETLNDMQNWDI
ncbi:MAG: 5'/3'-nucleotidase SurE [Melioribacteraceae bacterium]|nr:5'/3'-nucleotidase SurE [Melioribacteraceae bacterium]